MHHKNLIKFRQYLELLHIIIDDAQWFVNMAVESNGVELFSMRINRVTVNT